MAGKRKAAAEGRYSFFIQKRYTYHKKFSKKKKPQGLGAQLFGEEKMKFGKPERKGAAKEKAHGEKAAAPGPNRKIIIVLLIFAVLGALVFLMPKGAPPQPPVYVTPAGSLRFTSVGDIIDIGEDLSSLKHILYMQMDYSYYNATQASMSMDVYPDFDTREVYFLRAHIDRGSTEEYYDAFRLKLQEQLRNSGYNFNEVEQSDLATKHNSVIIITTGYLPTELYSGSPNIFNISKDNVVIYIGNSFNTLLNPLGSPVTLPPNEKCEDTYQGINCDGLTFISKDKSGFSAKCSGLNLNDPQYSVASGYGTKAEMVYGCVSKVPYEKGYMIFYPQSLVFGWESGEQAAADVFKFISESKWHSPLSSKTYNLTIANSTGLGTFFSGSFGSSYNDVYVKVKMQLQNEINSSQYLYVTELAKKSNGRLAISPSSTVPYSVSQAPIRLNIYTNEPGLQQLNPYVALKKGDKVVKTYPTINLPSQSSTGTQYDMSVEDSGEFAVEVTDGAKAYAAGYLRVSNINISGSVQFQDLRASFSFVDEFGRSVTISNVSVYLDGKLLNSSRRVSSVSMALPSSISPGKHNFTFDFGPGTSPQYYEAEYTVRIPLWQEILSKPLNQALLAITVIAAIIAFGVRRKEIPSYGIDIPDFPPLEFRKVYIKPEDVGNIMEQIEYNYSWKHMPLTTEEIKMGFSRYIYKGESLTVGEYNLQAIMDKLVNKGNVAEMDGYYSLPAWAEKSGHSPKYLTIYRKLRDIFMVSAVQFTKLGESKDADVDIFFGGERMHVFIYDGDPDDVLFRTSKVIGKGKVFIIFNRGSEVAEFLEELRSPSPSYVWLKLEIDAGEVLPLAIDQFRDFVATLKGK